MKFDENKIVDYFGEPHILVSTLNFHIDEMGAMHISSKKQWFYMFRRKIPLPRFLYGEANIVERYDETKQSAFEFMYSNMQSVNWFIIFI